jgi:hypothetical protein
MFRPLDDSVVSPTAHFAHWSFRTLDDSLPGRFAHWTVRTLDDSPTGRFAPWTIRTQLCKFIA